MKQHGFVSEHIENFIHGYFPPEYWFFSALPV
jgi:hypothetical protein